MLRQASFLFLLAMLLSSAAAAADGAERLLWYLPIRRTQAYSRRNQLDIGDDGLSQRLIIPNDDWAPSEEAFPQPVVERRPVPVEVPQAAGMTYSEWLARQKAAGAKRPRIAKIQVWPTTPRQTPTAKFEDILTVTTPLPDSEIDEEIISEDYDTTQAPDSAIANSFLTPDKVTSVTTSNDSTTTTTTVSTSTVVSTTASTVTDSTSTQSPTTSIVTTTFPSTTTETSTMSTTTSLPETSTSVETVHSDSASQSTSSSHEPSTIQVTDEITTARVTKVKRSSASPPPTTVDEESETLMTRTTSRRPTPIPRTIGVSTALIAAGARLPVQNDGPLVRVHETVWAPGVEIRTTPAILPPSTTPMEPTTEEVEQLGRAGPPRDSTQPSVPATTPRHSLVRVHSVLSDREEAESDLAMPLRTPRPAAAPVFPTEAPELEPLDDEDGDEEEEEDDDEEDVPEDWGNGISFIELEEVAKNITDQTGGRPKVRWCVLGARRRKRCWRLAKKFNRRKLLQLECVSGRHQVECMRFVAEGKADAVTLDAEEMYIAGRNFRLQPILYEAWPHEHMPPYFTEDVVVVIRKSSDWSRGLWSLKGKKLCLPGTSPGTLQAEALSSILLPLGMMPVHRGHCESPIPSIAAHFGPSCVPGPWSLDPKDREAYLQLCLLCDRVCTETDFHAGPDGSLRCLEGGGEVAFSNGAALARAKLDPDKYERLCIQGAKVPLNGTCAWLGRRTHGVAIAHDVEKPLVARWKKAMLKAFQTFYKPSRMHKSLLSTNNFTQLVDYYHEGYVHYTGLVFMRSMETPFPDTECPEPKKLRWCFSLRRHEDKCEDLALTLAARRLRPQLACRRARSQAQCQQWLRDGSADITVLQPEDAIAAQRDHNFKPVAVESYGPSRMDDVSGFLVAVVKKSRNITLETLIGAQACHTGVDDFLGWEAPYILLEKYYQISMSSCNFGRAASEVFWRSCVPGIREWAKGRGQDADFSGNLCSLCDHDCDRRGRFAGPEGALRCMSQFGDVTFLRNSSLALIPPSERGRYELLCLNGERRPLGAYAACNWLRLPTPTLVVSADRMGPRDRRKITAMLMEAQKEFGTARPDALSLFASRFDANTLFGPVTQRLRPVWPEEELPGALGEDFVHIRSRVLDCNAALASAAPAALLKLIALALALRLL